MKALQVILVFGVLGLALWGLLKLSETVNKKPDDFTSLANDLGSAQAGEKTPEASASPAESDPANEETTKKPDDYYPVNPFTMPGKEETVPKAVMAEKHHDFDRMAMGNKGTHEFVLKNEGTVPLKVAKGPTMCKCTLSSVKEQEIPPGKEIKISVEYEPKSLGDFSQTAIVWTNDPENSKVEMLITGRMFAEVTSNPESGWVLGSIPIGTEKEFEGYVYSSVQKDLEVTGIKSSSDQVSVHIDEIPPADARIQDSDSQSDVIKAFKITGKVQASQVAGTVKETVTVTTNNPNVKEISLPIQLARTGPLLVISTGWYAERQLLQMGRIKAAEGKTQKLVLMIEAFDKELELSNINTGLPFVSLTMKRESTPPDAPKHRYIIELQVAKDAPLGEWTGPKAQKISFDTNHPKVPHFEIHADFEIL